MATETLNPYEAMFLIGPAAATENDGGVKLCTGVIERHGGQILVIKKWDERKLAYEVLKQKRGTYVIAFFNAPGSAIVGIERDVKLSDEILRVLVTSADHLNQTEMAAVEPQPIVPREERPSYGWNDRPERSNDRGGDRGGDRGFDRGGDRGPRPPRRDEPVPAEAEKE